MLEKIYQIFKKSTGVNTDTRTIQKGEIFIALKGDNFNGNLYAKKALEKGAIAAIIDEDIDAKDTNIFRVENSLDFLQKLAQYHRLKLNIPIIGLTGSNGKTTTKELIANSLATKYKTAYTQGNLNNHIGVPLTLLSVNQSHEIAVIEMGANHPKEIETLCKIAIPTHGYITNFGKAHLEGFGSIEGVIKTKSELYESLLSNNGIAFVNADDKIQIEKTKELKKIKFGFNQKNVDYSFGIIENKKTASLLFDKTEIQSQLTGQYNAINIAAAVSISLFFDIEINKIKQAIESYIPKLNRSQIVKRNNVTYILDAYNANPTSMEASLKNLANQKGTKIAVLGDMFELGEYSHTEHQKIANLAESLRIDKIFLIGKNFYEIDSDIAQKFASSDSFQSFINENRITEGTILIKGSRGMALEKLNFQ